MIISFGEKSTQIRIDQPLMSDDQPLTDVKLMKVVRISDDEDEYKGKAIRDLILSIVFACRYTKHSQELLEYAIGTCPKDFNKRDKKHAPTPLIRKKQVTFEEQCDTSNSNTNIHVGKLNTQQTNVPVPPSTGVNCCTNASRSQPRSNTKKNKISPAKGVNGDPHAEYSP
ncbi:hypothetical protein Tco_1532891 [Tanacetum coccineum]